MLLSDPIYTSEFNSPHALSLKINSSSSPLLFSSSSPNRQGWGDYTVPPQIQARQQMVLIIWHPPAIQEKEAEKPAAPLRMCFPGSVCQSWQLFSHLMSELFTRALGECLHSTGGWEERRGEHCCFPTSASNQSPKITAMVYGLWS